MPRAASRGNSLNWDDEVMKGEELGEERWRRELLPQRELWARALWQEAQGHQTEQARGWRLENAEMVVQDETGKADGPAGDTGVQWGGRWRALSINTWSDFHFEKTILATEAATS